MESDYGIAVLVALAFSWIGDACLLSKKERVFLLGIMAFLLGHVGYIVAFAVRGLDPTWAGAAALGPAAPGPRMSDDELSALDGLTARARQERRSTLTKVAQAIVDYQQRFLDDGAEFI